MKGCAFILLVGLASAPAVQAQNRNCAHVEEPLDYVQVVEASETVVAFDCHAPALAPPRRQQSATQNLKTVAP